MTNKQIQTIHRFLHKSILKKMVCFAAPEGYRKSDAIGSWLKQTGYENSYIDKIDDIQSYLPSDYVDMPGYMIEPFEYLQKYVYDLQNTDVLRVIVINSINDYEFINYVNFLYKNLPNNFFIIVLTESDIFKLFDNYIVFERKNLAAYNDSKEAIIKINDLHDKARKETQELYYKRKYRQCLESLDDDFFYDLCIKYKILLEINEDTDDVRNKLLNIINSNKEYYLFSYIKIIDYTHKIDELAQKWLELYASYDSILTAKAYIMLHRYEKAYHILCQIENTEILRSVCCFLMNKKTESFLLMEEAIRKYQSLEYTNLFVNQHECVEIILRKIINRDARKLTQDLNSYFMKRMLYQIRNSRKTIIVDKPKLSDMQEKMLLHLIEDRSYNEICDLTGLKITTVRAHISKLYQKLNVHNQKEAIEKAIYVGLVEKK